MCPLGGRHTVIYLTAEGVLWMYPPGGRDIVIYLSAEGVLWMCAPGGRCTVIYLIGWLLGPLLLPDFQFMLGRQILHLSVIH